MFKALFDFFSSLKLAVILLLGLAASLAVATFVESGYDTHTAQFWVYRSWWFEGLLALLGVNILAVALSRLPWKPRHIPFLLAHLGILLLLTGSFLTQKFGLDGSMTVTEGEVSNVVDLGNAGLLVIDGESVRRIPVPWIPPGHAFKDVDLRQIGLPYDLKVDRYITHADPIYNFIPDDTPAAEAAKPAVQVTIKGGFMGIQQDYWLWGGDPQWSSIQAGPSLLMLGEGRTPKGSPSLQIIPVKGTGKNAAIRYVATSFEGRKVSGVLPASKIEGKVIDPGWRGGVKLILGRFVPRALPQTTYVDSRMQYGQQAPSSAVHLVTGHGGPGSSLWLGLGERAELEVSGREIEIGYMPERVILPFQVKLDRFRVDHYEGTSDPSEYSSSVTVLDQKGSHPVVISMNEPLTVMGTTLYQASYEDAMPRPITSIFSVNRDPGRPWKYLGSILIVLGSILLFVMKYRQNRPGKLQRKTEKKRNSSMKIFLAALLGFALVNITAGAEGFSPQPHSGWSFSQAGLIPVQSGGRLMPFDSFAREAVLYLTGSRSFEGWDPVDLMFSWLTYPAQWEEKPFIEVGRADVRRQLGIDEKRERFSPKELVSNFPLAQYAEELQRKGTVPSPTGQMAKKDQREEELKRVLDRVGLIRSIISGESWLLIPQPEPVAWLSVAADTNGASAAPEAAPDRAEAKFIRGQFVELVKAYQAEDPDLFKAKSKLMRAAVEGEIPGFTEHARRKIEAEAFYDRLHPFLFAWIFYLLAALAWFTTLARAGVTASSEAAPGEAAPGPNALRKTKWVAAAAMIVAVGFHVTGFALRCFVAGRPPVTNMYESVIWVSLGVVVFATVIYFVSKRQMVMLAVACSLACLGLIAGDAAPAILDPGIHPLVPVLRSNYWLTIHVLTITLGYAAFTLALGLGDVTLYRFIAPGGEAKNRAQILSLNQLTYRAMQFGVVLIAAGTILGGVWADYSWGRFWGWDPKEVWALIVLLSYLVILHGRYAGWVGQFGFAAWSVIAFLSVLMAWYGVNFILGVGLHSYGFSTGGFTAVMTFTAIQLSYVGFAWLRRVTGRRAAQAAH